MTVKWLKQQVRSYVYTHCNVTPEVHSSRHMVVQPLSLLEWIHPWLWLWHDSYTWWHGTSHEHVRDICCMYHIHGKIRLCHCGSTQTHIHDEKREGLYYDMTGGVYESCYSLYLRGMAVTWLIYMVTWLIYMVAYDVNTHCNMTHTHLLSWWHSGMSPIQPLSLLEWIHTRDYGCDMTHIRDDVRRVMNMCVTYVACIIYMVTYDCVTVAVLIYIYQMVVLIYMCHIHMSNDSTHIHMSYTWWIRHVTYITYFIYMVTYDCVTWLWQYSYTFVMCHMRLICMVTYDVNIDCNMTHTHLPSYHTMVVTVTMAVTWLICMMTGEGLYYDMTGSVYESCYSLYLRCMAATWLIYMVTWLIYMVTYHVNTHCNMTHTHLPSYHNTASLLARGDTHPWLWLRNESYR